MGAGSHAPSPLHVTRASCADSVRRTSQCKGPRCTGRSGAGGIPPAGLLRAPLRRAGRAGLLAPRQGPRRQ